jgi:hypothetical protein
MARTFANWLTAYASYTADSESPREFHLWTGIWTLAGALRRRVWIDMRKFQWTPNFYIVLVGPPGIVNKSTTSRTGMRLLEQVDGIKFGPPSITWQKLADSLSAAAEHMRHTKPDGTDAFLPMSCLTIQVSELGTFLKMEDGALVDVLVDLWDGQLSTWGHSTKMSGDIIIKNPWLNIIGCTTPSWLKANFPEHTIGGGLTSRIIFVHGDEKAKLIPYPDEALTPADYEALEKGLVADLKEIAIISGEYLLSGEARQWGQDWYTKHWDTSLRPKHLSSDRYGGYIARKQTHLHKLAIVLAASESSVRRIERPHLETAEALLLSVEPHMMKVFESIGVVSEARHLAELLPFLRAHGFLTADQLWKCVMNLMSLKDYEDALRAGLKGGTLCVAQNGHAQGIALAASPRVNGPAPSQSSP